MTSRHTRCNESIVEKLVFDSLCSLAIKLTDNATIDFDLPLALELRDSDIRH